MDTRAPLFTSDLAVSPLCMGTAEFGTATLAGQTDRLVAAFLEAGQNFFDTAHVYAIWTPGGIGASERELGAVLRRAGVKTGFSPGVRDSVVVATKGGHPPDPQFPDYQRPGPYLSPETLRSDIHESIERLGFAPIDLYYLHRDDGVTPVGEILEVLNEEIQAGHLRYLGASNWRTARIAEANAYAAAHGLQGFIVSQIQGSLAVPNWKPTDTEPTVRYLGDAELAWHRDSGLPVATYSATASGYFAGNPKSARLYDNPTNQSRRERAQALAAELGATPTQVAVAYLMYLPVRVVPIFATGRQEHLAEILGATRIHLTPEQVEWLWESTP